jgi:LacI family transcriptional regulator
MPLPRNQSSGRPVTLSTIADRTKMSRSGVSRALHNDPSIPLKTCRRVQEVARRLGFIGDRQLSRAFQLVRLTGRNRIFGTLGFIDAYPETTKWRHQPNMYITQLFDGARERAAELGYKLEIFSLMEPGMSARRLQSILDARGVGGLLVPPLPPDVHELPIDWNRYACVALTHTLQWPALHRVAPHQFQVMTVALEHLQRGGYRRIGFATWDELDVRVNHHFRAAYLSYQYNLPPDDRLPILMVRGDFADLFNAWYDQHKPDAIVGGDAGIIDILYKRRLIDFDRLGFASVAGDFLRPGHPLHHKVAYVALNTRHVGRAGVDQLVAQLDRRERGVPVISNVIMIEGTWMPGETVRAAAR